MYLDDRLIRELKVLAEERREAFLSDLGQLVVIDSGTQSREGVNRVADWLAARCARLGWDVARLPGGEYGDCLAVTLRGRGRARLLLAGHMDTVYPDGTAAARPISINGDILHGPGTCDMKAGLLTAIYATRALQEAGFQEFARLVLFFNSDEEVGSPVSQRLYAPIAAESDVALAFEAARANGDLVSARKGGGKYTLSVAGKSAHAGVEPEKGANAIVQLARLVDLAARLNGLLPGVTVNVGVIRGGQKTNIVPDRAEAELDVRACDAEGASAIHEALYRLAEQITVPGTSARVSGHFNGPPMERTPGNVWLAQAAGMVAQRLGFEVKDGPMTGGKGDANYLSAYGLPVLDGLGPMGGRDHSPDEYLLISSIPQRIALAAGLIATACTHVDALPGVKARST